MTLCDREYKVLLCFYLRTDGHLKGGYNSSDSISEIRTFCILYRQHKKSVEAAAHNLLRLKHLFCRISCYSISCDARLFIPWCFQIKWFTICSSQYCAITSLNVHTPQVLRHQQKLPSAPSLHREFHIQDRASFSTAQAHVSVNSCVTILTLWIVWRHQMQFSGEFNIDLWNKINHRLLFTFHH